MKNDTCLAPGCDGTTRGTEVLCSRCLAEADRHARRHARTILTRARRFCNKGSADAIGRLSKALRGGCIREIMDAQHLVTRLLPRTGKGAPALGSLSDLRQQWAAAGLEAGVGDWDNANPRHLADLLEGRLEYNARRDRDYRSPGDSFLLGQA